MTGYSGLLAILRLVMIATLGAGAILCLAANEYTASSVLLASVTWLAWK